MSKAAETAQRFRAIQQRDQAAEVEPEPAPRKGPELASNKPVRQTVDISPARHVALAQWRMETAVQLGRTRLSAQEVLSSLIGVLLTDETVARRLRVFLEDPDKA